MLFTDAAEVGAVRETRDGYLVAEARVARTGLQTYAGREVGRPDLDVVRVYRPEDEVFSDAAMASFAFRPLTNDHPAEAVTSKTWKRHAVGFMGGDVARDGAFLRMPLTLMDAAAIDAWRGGKAELSAGYTCSLDWTPGVAPDGQAYDAAQRNIRANHVALVRRGRAGAACRIGDAAPEQNEGIPMQNITIGDASFEVPEAVALHVQALAARDAEHARQVEARDGELAALRATADAAVLKLEAELADAQARIPDATALDALLAARARTLDAARRFVADADLSGRSEADIRRLAVAKRLGDAAVEGRSDEFVAAAFETLALVGDAASNPDRVRDALRDSKPADRPTDAYAAHLKNLVNAWKTGD